MARIKSNQQPLLNIRDWPHADELIREIGDIHKSIKAAEHEADTQIKLVKGVLEGKVSQLQTRQSLIVKSLEDFSMAHLNDFGEQRSRKLDFGTMGWRKSTAILIAGTTLEFIKAIFSPAKQKTVLRIKETVDKEALAKLTDEELTSIKARRKIRDVFFVEPSFVKAADHNNL